MKEAINYLEKNNVDQNVTNDGKKLTSIYFLKEAPIHSKALLSEIENPNFGFLKLESRMLTIWPNFERLTL